MGQDRIGCGFVIMELENPGLSTGSPPGAHDLPPLEKYFDVDEAHALRLQSCAPILYYQQSWSGIHTLKRFSGY